VSPRASHAPSALPPPAPPPPPRARSYELITGELLTPYGDLHRQICVETIQVCRDEAQAHHVQK
jgi:hypothetical protein